jgi:hypothetical protein
MMELFSTIFTSVLGGGATGLLGVLLQRYFDHKKQQSDIELLKLNLEAAHRTREMELQAQERMADKAADAAIAQAKLDAMTRLAESRDKLVGESYGNDRATFTTADTQQRSRFARIALTVVDAVRGLMRPGITSYMLGMLTAVFVWVRSLYLQMGMKLTSDQVYALTMNCVGTVFYLATTCVVWWFGVRPSQPPERRDL